MKRLSGTALALALLPAAAQAQDGNVVVPASEIGTRVVVSERARTDRRVVTPFSTERRLVVRPVGLPGAADSAVEPAVVPQTASATSAPATPASATPAYVDIGPLDTPSPPSAAATVPEGPFIDIGPYRD